jgi:hypothetical protein
MLYNITMSFINLNYYAEGVQSQGSGWLDKSLPTILGILIGFGLNRLYDFIKEQKTIKKSGEEFLLELSLFKEPLSKQIQSLKDTIEDFEKPEFKSLKLVANIPIDQDRFKSIDRLAVYKHFIKLNSENKEEGRRQVNKLYGILKVSEMESERMKSYFDSFIALGSAEHKKFTSAINDMLRSYSKFIVNIEKEGKKPTEDKFINALQPLFKILEENQDKTLTQITEMFCTPMAHKLAEFRIDDRASEIGIHLKACFDFFREHKSIKESYKLKFKYLKDTFEKLELQTNEILALHKL